MSEQHHADPQQYLCVDTSKLPWTPSPGGEVLRKRLHRWGPQEAGRVSSIVQYPAGAQFPAHEHPEGEEILVLDGVFSDQAGDWPAGTLLLNPEGFSHAPFSVDGCTLWVKLRQYAGAGREHLALQSRALDWQKTENPVIKCKPLYRQAGFPDSARIEQWRSADEVQTLRYSAGAELLLLAGHLLAGSQKLPPLGWLRLPAGHSLEIAGTETCTVYIREAALGYLSD